jgi:arylesterase/paraoxonase
VKKALLIVVLFLLLLGAYGGYILNVAGQFKAITPHFAGTCKAVPGVLGAEDITIHPETGVALIASEDRRAANAGTPKNGSIWSYDLTASQALPVNLTPDLKLTFHAHGLSLFPQGEGGTVMAVNHRDGGGVFGSDDDAIEIFDFKDGKLTHKKTVTHPLLKSVNDVVAIDGERFYATIDHAYSSGIMRRIEDYARLSMAFVVYYDGKTVKRATGTFRYANGINASHDGNLIYVAATTDGAISVFQRNKSTGELTGRRDAELGTGVDNIEIDEQGAIWVAGHPRLFDFLAHAKDPKKIAPSQVLKLTPNATRFNVTEVYLNDGMELSGSSVAAVYKDRMLIGPVMDPKFLDCTLK